MQIEIKKIGINGEGIGYYNKMPIFIDRALIGEIVDIEIIENNKSYKVGKIKRIIKKSNDRICPICVNYNKCDGCSLMHTNYANQLEIKKELVKEGLYKYSGVEIEDLQIVESKIQEEYRNCLKLPLVKIHGEIKTGIFVKDTNNIWAIDNCLVHSKLLEELKDKVLNILNKHDLNIYDKKTKKGLRYLVLREIGNRAHMCLITGEDNLKQEIIDDLNNIKEIVSIYQCINTSKNSVNIFSNKMIRLCGGKHLVFKIDDLKFNLSIKSFYQLNTNQAKTMYRYVRDLIDDKQELIVEAYAGIGAMSLLCKDKAKKIVGIEYINDAVVNANINASINKIKNVSFLCGDSATIIKKEFSRSSIDTLIVDPPRSGLDDNMVNTIMNINIKNIIYVSCNPATLSKNLKILLKKYNIDSIKVFDMFPHTAHAETVIKLIKRNLEN